MGVVNVLDQGKMIGVIFVIPARLGARIFDVPINESWQPFRIWILFNGL